ncbi:MAG: hypothetical protein ACKVP4_09570 [Hyphomicrobium sp.]
MALRGYQRGELLGVFLILGSVATQMFYLDPLKREIEWRLVAFNIQQSGQVQTKTAFANQLALLRAVNAPAEQIASAEAERDQTLKKYQTADANISDYLIEKERVEDYLQWVVIALFALGSLLTGLGRVMEMAAVPRET